MAGRVIWCLGMYASASTWMFNVVREIMLLRKEGKVQTHFFSTQSNVGPRFDADTAHVVKSHELAEEQSVVEVAKRAAKIIITLRDPRDAVVSLMQSHRYDFAKALSLVEQSGRLCKGFVRDARALVFSYESDFFDHSSTVRLVAQHLDLSLTEAGSLNVFEKLSRPAVEAFISTMPKRPGVLSDRISGDLLDPETQWHSHHAGRNGEIGKWRQMLTQDQAASVEKLLPEMLAAGDRHGLH